MNDDSLLKNFKESFDVLKKKKFKNSKDTSNSSPELFEVFNIWYEIFKSKIRVNSIISDKIFEDGLDLDEEENEDFFILKSNIEVLIDENFLVDAKVDEKIEWSKFISKVLDHVKLAERQMIQTEENKREIQAILGLYANNFKDIKVTSEEALADIRKNLNEISLERAKTEEEMNKMKNESIEVIDRVNKVNKKVSKTNKNSKNMQKEFIAILGIFAAILIATFGGLTALNSLFGQINTVATHKLLFIGAFLVLAILMILFLMLNGVSKLTNLSLRSCGCKDSELCTCKIHKKHPTIFILTILIISIIILSAAPTLIDLVFDRMNTEKFIFKFILLIIVIVVISYFLNKVFKLYDRNYVLLKEEIQKNKYELLKIEEQRYLEKRLILSRRIKELENEEKKMHGSVGDKN